MPNENNMATTTGSKRLFAVGGNEDYRGKVFTIQRDILPMRPGEITCTIFSVDVISFCEFAKISSFLKFAS